MKKRVPGESNPVIGTSIRAIGHATTDPQLHEPLNVIGTCFRPVDTRESDWNRTNVFCNPRSLILPIKLQIHNLSV